MNRKRFTEGQIIGALREQEAGAKAGDLARKHGISEATLYNWKAKYGGMEVSDAKRLKALEDENAKLKKLLAEVHLDLAALKVALPRQLRSSARADGGHPSAVGADHQAALGSVRVRPPPFFARPAGPRVLERGS
mgnify:CR=1 FL=1